MNEQTHDRKIVWISGASSGIGRATALLYARHGATVYVSARRKEELESLQKEADDLNGHIIPLPLDVTVIDELQNAFSLILEQQPRLDLVLANAGIYEPVPLEQLSAESVRKVMEVNFIGASNMICCVLPHFLQQGSGHVAAVASVVGYRGLPNSGVYGASKAALIHFLESLRFELAPRGIAVSIINPGFVRSRLTEKNTFHMPFLIDEHEAADALVQGLEQKKKEIAFPWQMKILAKFFQILPACIYDRIVAQRMVS